MVNVKEVQLSSRPTGEILYYGGSRSLPLVEMTVEISDVYHSLTVNN